MEPFHSHRIHDLKTVYLNFHSILNLLKSGYKFDDSEGPAALRQLEKSLDFLKKEISRIENEGPKT